MIQINEKLTPTDLLPNLDRFWQISSESECLDVIEASFPPGSASPVFTVEGKYSAQGWTEWTQGFQYGSLFLPNQGFLS